jgi:hypothetical protein
MTVKTAYQWKFSDIAKHVPELFASVLLDSRASFFQMASGEPLSDICRIVPSLVFQLTRRLCRHSELVNITDIDNDIA